MRQFRLSLLHLRELYWGLRKYSGEQELVWGNNLDCKHQWGHKIIPKSRSNWDTFEQYRDDGGAGKRAIGLEANQGSFCSLCGAWKGALGLEPTIDMYVSHLIEILREVKRVLRKDGVVFWNIGDSYWGGGNNRGDKSPISDKQASNYGAIGQLADHHKNIGKHPTLKPKDLCLIPFRIALSAQADGWWVRSVIIWHKPNPMPESVRSSHFIRHYVTSDNALIECPGCPKCKPYNGYILVKGSWRPTESHEYVLMLTKSEDYYTDAESVREPYTKPLNRWGGPEFRDSSHKYIELGGHDGEQHYGATSMFRKGSPVRPIETGRNLRSVWTVPAQPFSGAHFAVFPEKLVEICIKAATPEVGCCSKCGKPYIRDKQSKKDGSEDLHEAGLGWRPACKCQDAGKVPSVCLDPFAGAGTTLKVAAELGRRAIGYEISEPYCQLIVNRNRQQVLI